MDIKIFTHDDICDYEIRDMLAEKNIIIEMNLFESAVLCGIIKKYKPKNILEVGVSAGGTSALILKALSSYNLNSQLFSVDVNPLFYKDKSKRTGYAVNEVIKDPYNYHIFLGKYLPSVIESFGCTFDLCILDTRHSLPGELLDFLVSFPFMNKDAIYVLHDTTLFFQKNIKFKYRGNPCYATRILFDSCVGTKYVYPDPTRDKIPNIGIFQITDDTTKYLSNVIHSLVMKWNYKISDYEFTLYYNFIKKYYGDEAAEYFMISRKLNQDTIDFYNNLIKNDTTQTCKSNDTKNSIPDSNIASELNISVPISNKNLSNLQLIKILFKKIIKNSLPYGIVNFYKHYK